NRLPPNQSRTVKWPVLDASGPPELSGVQWSFGVTGLVKNPMQWSWAEFQALPRVKVLADFHCVTRWSQLDNLWEGVSTREIARRVEIAPEAKYVLVHAYDGGWTTNMPLDAFLAEDALFADKRDGSPLTLEHGAPLRLIVPRLYAWKSAKWVRGVEFLAEDEAGFWEQAGYHMNGDPWTEERFG
ncbi:MAG TPA: sulfite oxidase-like oxidoreductase, partial [Terriglobia bacterium]|nr:sulfite oxidase-like oxidoreductase [Terriglobia bacterium]